MKKMFVYELPYASRKLLCQILDSNDKWEELGGSHMGFEYTYLQYLRRRDSPTDELLTAWGNQNHTVNDLFVLLSKMQHYRAMTVLKEYVQEKFQHLLPEGEELMMNRPPFNKHWMAQGNVNQGNRNGSTQSYSVHEPPCAAHRPSHVTSPPHTFEDNKDLGFDQCNLNFETPTIKVTEKSVHEIKVQNVQDNTGNEMANQNCNAQSIVSNGSNHAGASQNKHLQLPCHQPSTLKPGQERKLSTSSVTSSVLEISMPQINYEDLMTATNDWDSSCILGRGGFGIVYKGTWKNTLVAIKKLQSQKQNQEVATDQLVRELRSLNYHRHDNVLSLYAYSINDSVACLVYQYMANGSLEDRLLCKQKTPPLNWYQRLHIMTGTARGIQFLHSLGEPPLVHGDIKSANILLDANFEPRIGDFGLAREGPLQQYTHVKVSKVHGTRPYLPEEFMRGLEFSVKVDTYSFGVVLFEVATGLRACQENRKGEIKFLKDHIESFKRWELHKLSDYTAGPDLCATATGLLTLGLNCVTRLRQDRPDMSNVLNDVNKLYDIYKDALRSISMARQRSLTPTSPVEIQVAFDELHNLSPTNCAPPQFPQLVPQPTQQSSQVDNSGYTFPSHVNTSPIPLVSILKSKPEDSHHQASVLLSTSDHNGSRQSTEVTGQKRCLNSSHNGLAPSQAGDMYESACLPLVSELQGLRLAGPSTSTSDAY